MDFTNTLPSSSVSGDDKTAPYLFTGSEAPTPSETSVSRRRNVQWTPARHAKYVYVLHVISLVLGTLTLAAYIFDLAKSASYHVGVPVAIMVVDVSSIVFLVINNVYSIFYFVTDMNTDLSQGDSIRRWPLYLDVTLHAVLLGLADTTLAMRSSARPKNCGRNRAVGGCVASRRVLMIVAGIVMIFVR